MALQGSLRIDGASDKQYGIIQCEYEFKQEVDSTGKPTSRPKGGIITFVMPTTSDDDVSFYKWMVHKTEVRSGVFKFCVFSNNNKRSYKTVSFMNAYCIGLKDFFNNNDSRLMYTQVTLSAEVIRVGNLDGAMIINEWGGSMQAVRDKFENVMDTIGAGGMF